MAELAGRYRTVHLDVGSGDGAFVLRHARLHPDQLVIGVDASLDGLRAAARRARAKPARGGVPNAIFGRLALEDAPGELAGLAGAVTVLLPWGSLLRAVAAPDREALGRLRALCRPGAWLEIVFGYGAAETAAVAALGLPPADAAGRCAALAAAYRDAGLQVTARPASRDEIRALPTTWAKRLAFSDRARAFVAVRGRARE